MYYVIWKNIYNVRNKIHIYYVTIFHLISESNRCLSIISSPKTVINTINSITNTVGIFTHDKLFGIMILYINNGN